MITVIRRCVDLLKQLFVSVIALPLLTLIIAVVCQHSLTNPAHLGQLLHQSTWQQTWSSIIWDDKQCWLFIGILLSWSFLTVIVPKQHNLELLLKGQQPNYAFTWYMITLLISSILIYFTPVYELCLKFNLLVAYLFVLCLIFSFIFYTKGTFFAEQSKNNPITDFLQGVERHPRITSSVDYKSWLFLRFAHYWWQIMALICLKANHELNASRLGSNEQSYLQVDWAIMASVTVITIHLFRIHWYQSTGGYSMDIYEYKVGYLIIYGYLVILPCFYELPFLYLVHNSPEQFGFKCFVAVVIAGSALNLLIYAIEQQRVSTRLTDGNLVIWGERAKFLRAKYIDHNGNERNTILLTSGFWGVSRHLNHTIELAVMWLLCAPALTHSLLPYLLSAFITGYIVSFGKEDNEKCRAKYGKVWDEYCQLVPYKLIPGLY